MIYYFIKGGRVMPKRVVKTVKEIHGYARKDWYKEFEYRYGVLMLPLICNDPCKATKRTKRVRVTMEEIDD